MNSYSGQELDDVKAAACHLFDPQAAPPRDIASFKMAGTKEARPKGNETNVHQPLLPPASPFKVISHSTAPPPAAGRAHRAADVHALPRPD